MDGWSLNGDGVAFEKMSIGLLARDRTLVYSFIDICAHPLCNFNLFSQPAISDNVQGSIVAWRDEGKRLLKFAIVGADSQAECLRYSTLHCSICCCFLQPRV